MIKRAPHIQKIRDGYGAKFDGRRKNMIDEKNPYLKPCPFCGESSDVAVVDLAHVHEGDCREDVVLERAVECQNCGAHGGTANTREGAASSRQIVEGLRNVAIAMRALAETLEAIEMEEWRRETQGLWLI